MEDGVYFGVRIRGRLVSAAGTHAVNAREGIAAFLSEPRFDGLPVIFEGPGAAGKAADSSSS